MEQDRAEFIRRAIEALPEIHSVRLQQPGRPEIRFGRQNPVENLRLQTIPLRYVQEGKTHELGTLLRNESARWSRIAKDANIRAD